MPARERIIAAINHVEPDRVPVVLGAIPKEVKKQVCERLEIFSKDGGFVFNTVHNILPDVPPENIVAMFEAIDEFN